MSDAGSGLARASLILVVGFVGSRALGVLRNMVLAATFGAGAELDAYFAAFRLPDALFQLIVGAALASAFIPTFASFFNRASPDAAWRLASASINILSLVGVIGAWLGFVLAPWIVPWTVAFSPPEQQALTVDLARVMMLSTAFFCASGMITGVLNARFHFLLPALAPWLYNLSIIAGALLLHERVGILGPALGVAVGACLHLLVQLPGLAMVGLRYRATLNPRTPGIAEVLRLMGPRVITLGAAQVSWLVTQVLASGLTEGSITALTYAWALVMVPVGIFGMAPATAAFPSLAEAVARLDWARYRDLLSTGIRRAVFLSVPGSAGLILLREPLVTLLFERGEFDRASTLMTAVVLVFFSLGLFAHVLLEIAARGSYALRDTRTPLVFALVGMVAHAAFSVLLVGPGGTAGLALAMSLSTTVEALGLLVAVARRTGGFDWQALLASSAKTLAATASMAAVVALLLAEIPLGMHSVGLIGQVVLAALAGGGVFLGVSALLHSDDLSDLVTAMLIRRRGAGIARGNGRS